MEPTPPQVTDIDFQRQSRQGFPEIIYGEAKTLSQLHAIILQHQKSALSVLITRLQPAKAEELLASYQDSHYDELGRVLRIGANQQEGPAGQVAVIAAGTSDLGIVAEIVAVLTFLGVRCKSYPDKGVAGLHRLLGVIDELSEAAVVICVAGFEGALASIVAGLIHQPIIGVPSSIGYGVAKGGFTALNGMLASCANGLTVVNIDNGYGAAMAAYRILNSQKSNAGAGGTMV